MIQEWISISTCWEKNRDTCSMNSPSHPEPPIPRPAVTQSFLKLPGKAICSILRWSNQSINFVNLFEIFFIRRISYTYSGIPSGGRTTDTILSINLYFKILSFTVVDVRDGEAFTWKKAKIWMFSKLEDLYWATSELRRSRNQPRLTTVLTCCR